MELAILSALVSLSGSLGSVSCRIFDLLFVRFLMVEFIFPAFFLSSCFASDFISWLRFWSFFCGFEIGVTGCMCCALPICSIFKRNLSSLRRKLGSAHLPLLMLVALKSYRRKETS